MPGLKLFVITRLKSSLELKRNICRVGRAVAKPTELTNDPVFSWHGAWHGAWCMVYGMVHGGFRYRSTHPTNSLFIFISNDENPTNRRLTIKKKPEVKRLGAFFMPSSSAWGFMPIKPLTYHLVIKAESENLLIGEFDKLN